MQEIAASPLYTEKMVRKIRAIARQLFTTCPHRDMELDDLIAYGWEGVYHAAKLYDPRHASGATFNSYAGWWIRYYIQRGIQRWGKVNLRRQVAKDVAFVDSDALSLRDGPKRTPLRGSVRTDIWNLLTCLPEREAKVLILKHYYGYTDREIASVMEISRGRVDQLEKIAIGKLREEHEGKQTITQQP